ncbi:MAG: MarR family transcriptional regulator [Cytophagales bacterium]|nr:MarR family transcriptional regulator [Cytophagales bacterium]
MDLSEEIHQKEFTSLHQKALINILYTYNYIVGEMNVFFKANDLTRQQYNVLRILRGQYPHPSNISLVKERMLDKMSDASRIIQRLHQKQLVERKIAFDDRRSVEITITQQGLELLSNTDEQVKGFTHLVENLTPEEAEQLNFLLDKIRG